MFDSGVVEYIDANFDSEKRNIDDPRGNALLLFVGQCISRD